MKGSVDCLYNNPQFWSVFSEADRCFDRMSIYNQDIVRYIDAISRQTFKYATPIYSDINPQIIVSLNPDNDKHYVITSKPVKQATPTLFESKEVQSAVSSNTFTAQEAGSYKLNNFWNRVSFKKHSDTTLQPLRKVISVGFLASSENYKTDWY